MLAWTSTRPLRAESAKQALRVIPDVYPVSSIAMLIPTSAGIFQLNGSLGQFDNIVDKTTDAIRHFNETLEAQAALDPFPVIPEKCLAGFGIDGAVLGPRKLVRRQLGNSTPIYKIRTVLSLSNPSSLPNSTSFLLSISTDDTYIS